MDAERSVMSRHMDKMPMSSLGWGGMLALGLVTLIIGVILAAAPIASLALVAVLLGVVMVVTGIYYVVRAVAGREGNERAWHGVCGVVFILAGLALLRNLNLSVALIGLFIGFTWVIQGVLLLMEGFSRGRRHAHPGWTLLFGVISLIAGIVVVASPIASVAVLTIFLGLWCAVMGLIEIVGSFLTWRAARATAAGGVSVPQPRPSEASESAAARDTARDTVSHGAPGERNAGQGTYGDTRSTGPGRSGTDPR